MLVELAIGDAYGAGFEYVAREFVEAQNQLTGYVQHPRHGMAPGAYTDDTQMSIAIAEAMLQDEPWTPKLLAEHFVTAFKRDPREGYASGFYGFLQEIQDAEEFLARIRPHSKKNGAAMRAGPIGLYAAVDEVIARATMQAELTHNSSLGRRSAIAAALMTHYFYHKLGPKAELSAFLRAHVPGPWLDEWQGKVGSPGTEAVRAALTAILAHDSLRAILHHCIAFRGDVDTVATIALCAASCAADVTQDLPAVLHEGLEDGPYGRGYLLALDAQLRAKFGDVSSDAVY